MKKYFYKINLLLSSLFSKTIVYAEDFFEDYREINQDGTLIPDGTSQQLADTFGFGYVIIK